MFVRKNKFARMIILRNGESERDKELFSTGTLSSANVTRCAQMTPSCESEDVKLLWVTHFT